MNGMWEANPQPPIPTARAWAAGATDTGGGFLVLGGAPALGVVEAFGSSPRAAPRPRPRAARESPRASKNGMMGWVHYRPCVRRTCYGLLAVFLPKSLYRSARARSVRSRL